METIFFEYIDRLKKTLDRLDHRAIARLGETLEKARLSGNGIFIFGNGGSGANASHIAGDFVKGASFGLEQRYRFTCLNDNASGLMATANDIGWDFIFSEPLKGFLRPGDVVIG
ncbi:MAG: SIS domain-containing protein, partial [Spirochaetia bacterium]|nr:SIS domain-containing protein [Spirochaetia bacterium]